MTTEAMFLRVRAPFGAFRPLQAGVYRGSSRTIPPSAAWGLVLNVAGIETRAEASTPVTQRARDVPHFEVAIGELMEPQRSSLYQQLHGYPVGNSGKDLAEKAHGSKFWIAPARREVLVGLDLVIGMRSFPTDLAERLRHGLEGKLPRYGLPFLGDNNFLVDRLEILGQPPPARWYGRMDAHSGGPVPDAGRLTIDIDRKDSSRTVVGLYARAENAAEMPPENAWTYVPSRP